MFKATKTIPLLTEIMNRKGVSVGDAVIYSALRFKLNLSIKNNYKDELGYYVIYEQKDIMADTGLCKSAVIKSMKRLESEEVNLIKRVQLGRTFKTYFVPYDVEERFLIKNNPTDGVCGESSEGGDSNTPPKDENATEGELGGDSLLVDNLGDNLGIENDSSSQNTPNDDMGVQNEPIDESVPSSQNTPNDDVQVQEIHLNDEIGLQSEPYNKNIYKKNINKKRIKDNNNTFTFTKGHTPTVVIDDEIYIAFNKSFNQPPTANIKRHINTMLNAGTDKELLLYLFDEFSKKGWSWGSVVNELEKSKVKTLDEYLDLELQKDDIHIAPQERVREFRTVVKNLVPMDKEPSEWQGVDQYKLI